MAIERTKREVTEFGDFQTPPALALKVCEVIQRQGLKPASILEPTCGVGNFLFCALDEFPFTGKAVGLELNPAYLNAARTIATSRRDARKIEILDGNFFTTDWDSVLNDLPGPLLVIGNPPWVTSAELGSLGSANLPQKSNFQGHSGLAAKTGKSNFDISEWMLIRVLHWLSGKTTTMAMLCKTAVARKLLFYAWKHHFTLLDASIHKIDALAYFGASVDACLLVCNFSKAGANRTAKIYDSLEATQPVNTIGTNDDKILASIDLYERWKHLEGQNFAKWRSGVKHDCSKVMELRKESGVFRNGLGELVEIEDEFLFPMMKSSEVANGTHEPKRWMIVTQKSVGEDTGLIREVAPRTWEYLEKHAAWLDKRGSSIYNNRPQFSVFGVGGYTFAPWKVAISGLYKKLAFKVIGPFMGKPVVLDDTSYFLPCNSENAARFMASLLDSEAAREFFLSFIFWDAKRPITSDLLNSLDIEKLSFSLGQSEAFRRHLEEIQNLTIASTETRVMQSERFL